MCSLYDCFRAAVLVLGFGYIARQDRKTWMWAGSVMWGVYSAVLFVYPGFLFPGTTSASFFFLVRLFASLIGAGQFGIYICRSTRDESVIGTILWSRLLSAGMLVFMMGYAYSQKSELFPNKTLYFDILAIFLAALTTAYKMWEGQYRVGGREQKGYVSTICRVFFLMTFLVGLCFLAFPSWMLFKKPDTMEIIMLRCIGCQVFSGSIVWWYATSFRDDADRSAAFKWYLVTSGLMFVAMCLGYFRDGAFSRQDFLGMHCAFLPVLLAALGQYLLYKDNSGSYTSSYYLRSKAQ